MRRLLFALLLLMAPLAWAENSYSARVIRVIDGDTLVIEATGRVLKVRLFGVDCPEMSQPGGEHAAWFTGNMVAGKMVEVAEHDTDRYGRTVAEIILPDNRDLNKELVKHGEAWWYAEFDRDDAEMQQLEARARERRIGLWVESNPLPPWEWRKAARGMRSSSLRARVRSVSYQER